MKNSKFYNIIKKIASRPVVLGLQAFVSVFLLILLFKLGIIPTKYMIVLIIILIILFLIMFFLTKPVKKHHYKESKRTIIGKILSVLLSILLAVGCMYVVKGDSTLSKITGANSQTQTMSVIVLEDSEYEEIKDLENKEIATNNNVDKDNINKTLEEIRKTISIKNPTYSDFTDLGNGLYNKDVDAICINEAYRTMLQEDHESFDNETRVIYTFEIEESIENSANAVNVTKTPFTIYISGIDTYGKVSTVSRTDVNMLVTVNPNTKTILMTSIPRDYYVPLAMNGQKDKLTHSGLYGVNETVSTISEYFDININYYARVNFTSLITMVDALGGIDVYSDKTFVPWTNRNITIYEGTNHMNGEMALAFSRERHAYAEGDNHRVQNQQNVLTAMLKKMMSSKIITNYSSILNAVSDAFQTNMTSSDITSLINMQINDMSDWTFLSYQVAGKGSTSTSCYSWKGKSLYVMIPDDSTVSTAKQLINDVEDGKTDITVPQIKDE